mmetsp:Transcript_17253/g.36449  ORF Transcript_17253/g.36449 Transcript_17253/m.36449 type:complete len:284 (-) Transcript_17253:395-1246(-)
MPVLLPQQAGGVVIVRCAYWNCRPNRGAATSRRAHFQQQARRPAAGPPQQLCRQTPSEWVSAAAVRATKGSVPQAPSPAGPSQRPCEPPSPSRSARQNSADLRVWSCLSRFCSSPSWRPALPAESCSRLLPDSCLCRPVGPPGRRAGPAGSELVVRVASGGLGVLILGLALPELHRRAVLAVHGLLGKGCGSCEGAQRRTGRVDGEVNLGDEGVDKLLHAQLGTPAVNQLGVFYGLLHVGGRASTYTFWNPCFHAGVVAAENPFGEEHHSDDGQAHAGQPSKH